MPESDSSFEGFLANVMGLAFVGVSIYGVGRLIHRSVGRDDERRFEHGRFIPEWVAGTYLALGLGTLFVFWVAADVDASYAAGELASLGILIGLVIGWIHGSKRIRTQPPSPIEVGAIARDDPNPYRPPVTGGSASPRDPKR